MISLSKPVISEEEKQAVMRVLDSGMIAQGPEVAAFEDEFSLFMEGHHCIAVNSGTSALHLGLLASGIECGDEVIIPSFTFAATANAVALVEQPQYSLILILRHSQWTQKLQKQPLLKTLLP